MKRRGWILIANAAIWGAVIVASAIVLKGTGYSERILALVGVGFAASSAALGLGGGGKKPPGGK